MGLNIGIDFGTSTLYLTRWNEKKKCAEPLKNITKTTGEKLVENVIYYESIDNQIVGNIAVKKGIIEPDNYVEYVKRHLDDKDHEWNAHIKSIQKDLTAEEVMTDIFKYLKTKIEENHGGETIDNVVISVPYAFQQKERNAIRNSAISAGLNVIKLVEEPVAAAISYGVFHDNHHDITKKQTLVVFDFGGGTLDITLFEMRPHPTTKNGFVIEVINTDGDKRLGGRDIDILIRNKFIEKLESQITDGSKLTLSKKDQLALSEEARRLKEDLSVMTDSDAIRVLEDCQLNLDMNVTQDDFSQWLIDNGIFSQIKDALNRTFANPDVTIKPQDVDKILLVGGSSNIPLVQQEVEAFFGKPAETFDDPAHMVGEGAGIFCGSLLDDSLHYQIIDKISHSIGVKGAGNKFDVLIHRNTAYKQFPPAKQFTINKKTLIRVYEGNGAIISDDTHIEIGVIKVDNPEKFVDGKMKVQLGTDNSGLVLYKLLDKNHKVIDQGQVLGH